MNIKNYVIWIITIQLIFIIDPVELSDTNNDFNDSESKDKAQNVPNPENTKSSDGSETSKDTPNTRKGIVTEPSKRSWIGTDTNPKDIMNFDMRRKPLTSEPYYITNFLNNRTLQENEANYTTENMVINEVLKVSEFSVVKLSCNVPGLDNYQVKWTTKMDLTHLNEKIRLEGSSFQIRNITREFTGIYQCLVSVNLTLDYISNEILHKEDDINDPKNTKTNNKSHSGPQFSKKAVEEVVSTTSNYSSMSCNDMKKRPKSSEDMLKYLSSYNLPTSMINFRQKKLIQIKVEYRPDVWIWVVNAEQIQKKLSIRQKTGKSKPVQNSDTNTMNNEKKSNFGEIELHCLSMGFPIPQVRWYLNTTQIKPSKDEKEYSLITNKVTNRVMKTILKIRKPSKQHFGMYHCLASNTQGDNQKILLLHNGSMVIKSTLDDLIDIGPKKKTSSDKISLSFFIVGMSSPVIIGLYIIGYLLCYKPLPKSEIGEIFNFM